MNKEGRREVYIQHITVIIQQFKNGELVKEEANVHIFTVSSTVTVTLRKESFKVFI